MKDLITESKQFPPMRAYTIAEIDAMRGCVIKLFEAEEAKFNVTHGRGCHWSPPSLEEVEIRLRTYMLCSTEPDALRDYSGETWAQIMNAASYKFNMPNTQAPL